METKYTTPSQMRQRLIERATDDEEFRAQLLADPEAAVQKELGVSIPAGFTIKVHEEAADTGHLVLPPPSRLDESELAQTAGGRTVAPGRQYANDEAITMWDDW